MAQPQHAGPVNTQDAPRGLRTNTYRQYKDGEWRTIDDVTSPEVQVELVWPGAPVRTLWAYPRDLSRLALGHAFLELCAPGEIPAIEREEERRFTLAPSSCAKGQSGNGTDIPQKYPLTIRHLHGDEMVSRMQEFMGSEGRWNWTGCFHRAGLFNITDGTFLDIEEDIGRHNCIDRLAGWCVQNGLNCPARKSLALFVSARVTGSLAAKIARAGFGCVVSRSAVTEAAIVTARSTPFSLAGFARDNRVTIFTDPNSRFEQSTP
ncbi:formate dehydrogenase accessory sulfurtransferase FdhD [Oceanidesulfovibrio marinus]|uniref:FdhD protein n=1 Tax=Oceanidesulfovibrio marinus TaxID=370038 RepID=A0A6P1ZGE0_9BACT|nr:formate dehydrogenase accessory sulfurtransferase FdhD [Oceanidesulfovibrio marinus]TVM33715.1 hypothetical protein DQK91_10855 [Oceanidesulfovibrio marinus]